MSIESTPIPVAEAREMIEADLASLRTKAAVDAAIALLERALEAHRAE